MVTRHGITILFSAALAFGVTTVQADSQSDPTDALTAEAAKNGVPNFHLVDVGVYRGGQPTAAGWAYLKSKGIKTDVKLDLASEGSDDEAARLGVTVVDASGPPSDIKNFFEAPTRDRIRLAVQTLEDESSRPVYVHCLHGQDRTGLVVGLYRVHHDHYTKAKAFREMRKLGFHWEFLGLLDVWEDFDGKTLP